jgi:hypothetical protein
MRLHGLAAHAYFLLLLSVLARQIVIAPKGTLTFIEDVDKDSIYKFIYNTKSDVSVTLTDASSDDIVKTAGRSATIYTQVAETGKMSMTIKNLENYKCVFAYKCPDTNKELAGHVGYVKDTDLVGGLPGRSMS